MKPKNKNNQIIYCCNCGKKLSKNAWYYGYKRCKKCNYKNRNITSKKYYCKEKHCHNEITYETVRNGQGICKSCAGKIHSKFMTEIQKIKGNFNFKKGKPKCIDCGKQLARYGAIRCQSCSSKGELGSNWIDGRSYEKYPSIFTPTLKRKILERDNHTCQLCELTEKEHLLIYKRILDIHHIDYNRKNCQEDNLISLCRPCNIKVNYNRNYWQKKLQKKILEIKNNFWHVLIEMK